MKAACEQLEAYLDDRLSGEALGAFEAHAERCARCAPAIEAWRRTGAKLEAWAAPFSGPPSAQQLRDFRARGERPATTRWLPIFAGLGALAALALFFVLRPAPVGGGEWQITASSGAVEGSQLVEAQTYRIGPDEIDLAAAAKVEVTQRDSKRTRLVLTRGALTARVEPGRVGREFVIDSPPFRVTVVGTVFNVRREFATFHVATSKGLVRVERLGAAGEVLDSKLVPAGSQLELSEAVAPEAVEVPVDAGPAVAPAVQKPVPVSKPQAAVLLAWRKRAARGECEAVFEETQLALKATPNHVATLRVNADCARKLGISAAAVDGYRKVIANSSGAEAAEAMLLAASLMQDELHDARGVLEVTKAIRGAPPEVAGALHVRRARALQTLGRKAEARAEVELTLKDFGATPAAADALRLKSEL